MYIKISIPASETHRDDLIEIKEGEGRARLVYSYSPQQHFYSFFLLNLNRVINQTNVIYKYNCYNIKQPKS